MKMIFFDVETAGIGIEYPIIQIAMVAVFESDFEVCDEFSLRIRFDEKKADKRALDMNHYDPELWKKVGVPSEEASDRICNFLNKHATHRRVSKAGKPYNVCRLAAHNANFDAERLWLLLKDRFVPADRRVLCTMQRALWWFQERSQFPEPENYKLKSLCEYFNIHANPDRLHDAIEDVRLTVALARRLSAEGVAV
jgi:DNA polymerase III epsilon subunit-like protein